MEHLELSLPPTPRRVCRLCVGAGVLDRLVDDLVREPPGSPLVVISDQVVAPLHGRPLVERLVAGGIPVELLTFPAGEAHKIRSTKDDLEDGLLRLHAGRDAAIVAVGGGVTGDLAGFVAATWHRGIPIVQVPTSLLAMVDAALGGKTAVNLSRGKNLVGAFHQPLAVYADVRVLATLPDRELREGLAELVKSAVIADARLFRWLEQCVPALIDRDADALEHAIAACLRIKGRVVARDERDRGRRAVLNFGHTVAHALEVVSGYALSHGTAVSIGMCVEARLAVQASGFPSAHVRRLEQLLQRCGLQTELPAQLSREEIVRATRRDKKARKAVSRYAVPRSLGRMLPGAEVTVEVGEDDLRRALEGTG